MICPSPCPSAFVAFLNEIAGEIGHELGPESGVKAEVDHLFAESPADYLRIDPEGGRAPSDDYNLFFLRAFKQLVFCRHLTEEGLPVDLRKKCKGRGYENEWNDRRKEEDQKGLKSVVFHSVPLSAI